MTLTKVYPSWITANSRSSRSRSIQVLAFGQGMLDQSQAMTYLGLGCIVACLPLALLLRSERS